MNKREIPEVRALKDEIQTLKSQIDRLCKKVVQLNNENYSFSREVTRLKGELSSAKAIIDRFKKSKETDWNLIVSQQMDCPICNQPNSVYIGFRGKIYGPVVVSYSEDITRAKMQDVWDIKTIYKYKAIPDYLPPDAENWYYRKGDK